MMVKYILKFFKEHGLDLWPPAILMNLVSE